jgi:hypothetical protein
LGTTGSVLIQNNRLTPLTIMQDQRPWEYLKYNLTDENVGYLGCFCQGIADRNALGCDVEGQQCGGKAMFKFEFGDRGGPNPDTTYRYCEDWSEAVATKTGTIVGMIFGIIAINLTLKGVLRALVDLEAPDTETNRIVSLTLKLFAALLVNTCIITILIKGNPNSVSTGSPADVIFRQFGILEGTHGDFSAAWYMEVGTALCTTMAISIFSPQATKIAQMFTSWLAQCQDRGCRTIKHSSITHRATQHDLEELYLGPEIELERMYAEQLNMLFICLMFNSGMPFLTLVCFVNVCVTYFFDKLTFLRLYRLPPAIDETAATTATSTLKYALILHVVIATWMWSNPDIVEQAHFHPIIDETVVVANSTYVQTVAASNTEEDDDGALGSSRIGSRILGSVQVVAYVPLLALIFLAGLVSFLLCIFPDVFNKADRIAEVSKASLRRFILAKF